MNRPLVLTQERLRVPRAGGGGRLSLRAYLCIYTFLHKDRFWSSKFSRGAMLSILVS